MVCDPPAGKLTIVSMLSVPLAWPHSAPGVALLQIQVNPCSGAGSVSTTSGPTSFGPLLLTVIV
jgi:hypothetical protein